MKEWFKACYACLSKSWLTLVSVATMLCFSRPVVRDWVNGVSKRAYVLGNGPSLRNDLPRLGKVIKGQAGDDSECDVWVVNNFCFSREFYEIKPSFYVLADSAYWCSDVSDELAAARLDFVRSLKEVSWLLTLLVPRFANNSELVRELSGLSSLKIVYYNLCPVDGFDCVSYYACDKGFGMPTPYNVLVAALSLSIGAGYQEIVIAGADHSWHEQIKESDGRTLVKQEHFYDDAASAQPMYKAKDNAFTIGDMFLQWGSAFKKYEFLQRYADHKKVAIFNVSSRSYIDSFVRCEIG